MEDTKIEETRLIVGLQFEHESNDEEIQPRLIDDGSEGQFDLSPLNADEKQLLEGYEKTIDDGFDGFVQVGISLWQIKKQKLYREGYRTFSAYCEKKWGFTRSHATRLIKSSKIVQGLTECNQPGNVPVAIPLTEAAARELKDLRPDEQVLVAQDVRNEVGDGKPNAADFRKAKAKRFPDKTPKKRSNRKEGKAEPQSDVILMPTGKAGPVAPILISPAQLHDLPESEMRTLRELSDDAKRLFNVWATDKDEAQRLIVKLHKWLPLYAEWFEHVVASEQKEAA